MEALREFLIEKLRSKVSLDKAKEIEKLVFDVSEEYIDKQSPMMKLHVYKQKGSLIFDLLDQDIIKQLNEGKIDLKEIMKLDSSSEQNTHEMSQEQEVSDGIFQCRKCGSKKTTYYSLQTRSADEPMTNFITCVSCKNRWKM